MRQLAVLALAGLLAGGALSGCSTGCNQEMDHGGNNDPDGAASTSDAGGGMGDGGLPFCPDAGPPPDASPTDAGLFDAGVVDAGMPPDAGPPTCRYPWDAGPS
ncbi:MAG TPA: hypothetical protein VFU21_27445 [Kofleriaceae bacterium]|nr:hypothetical protein [Kofleriaceae bacterium]